MSRLQDAHPRHGRFSAMLTQMVAVALLAVAPSARAAISPTAGPGNNTQSIVGGELDPTCAHPTTVSFGYCSGTLIHPRVVLSAAHCKHEDRATTVFIGDSFETAQHTVQVDYCTSYPAFDDDFGRGTDWAYCVLQEPILDVPIVPPAMGCELDYLAQDDAQVTLVGFGREETDSRGRKRSVTVAIENVHNGEVKAGGDGKAGCHGDSGGSAFITLPDQTKRLLGIISYAKGECGTPEYIVLAHRAIGWIESELAGDAIDLTPCTDETGAWSPSENCRFAAVQSADEAQSCSLAAKSTAWSQTCGPAQPDFVAPTQLEPFFGEVAWEPADAATWRNLGLQMPPHAVKDESSGCNSTSPADGRRLLFVSLLLLLARRLRRQRRA